MTWEAHHETQSLRFAVARVGSDVEFRRIEAKGDTAPDFKTQASLAGKEFTFSLRDALKKGPVVVYFYPAAFTGGCNPRRRTRLPENPATSSPPQAPRSSAFRSIAFSA